MTAAAECGKMKKSVGAMVMIKSFFVQGKTLAKNTLFVTMVISNCIGTAGS